MIGGAASAAVNPSNQMPDMSQSHDLPGSLQTQRQASSIPIGMTALHAAAASHCRSSLDGADHVRRVAAGASSLPGHQPGDAVVWQYPSERMFFNAMKRKGWDAKEEDMSAIVAIHNGVNERAWYQVCRYEV